MKTFLNLALKSNGTVFFSVLLTQMFWFTIEEGPKSVFREPGFSRLEIRIRESSEENRTERDKAGLKEPLSGKH